jgi:hypothetical protein
MATSRRAKLTAHVTRADEMRHASENCSSFPLGYYAMRIHKQVPALPKSVLPPSSGKKNKDGIKIFLRNIGTCLLIIMELHLRRKKSSVSLQWEIQISYTIDLFEKAKWQTVLETQAYSEDNTAVKHWRTGYHAMQWIEVALTAVELWAYAKTSGIKKPSTQYAFIVHSFLVHSEMCRLNKPSSRLFKLKAKKGFHKKKEFLVSSDFSVAVLLKVQGFWTAWSWK